MHGRSRFTVLIVMTVAIVALSLSTSYAQRMPGQPPSGQPMIWAGQANGQPAIQTTTTPTYYIWFDQNGWHVRWSSIGPNLFSGQLTTNGQFTDVRSDGRLGKWVTTQGDRLPFLSGIVGGIDGFDFKTTGDTLTFSLLVNQRMVSPSQVVLGSAGARASAMPFTLTRVPLSATGVPGREPLQPQDRH